MSEAYFCPPGFEPNEGFVCHMQMCGPNTDYKELISKNLYGTNDENGKTDYCKMFPLKNTSLTGVCEEQSFDTKSQPQVYCQNYNQVTYAPFYMSSSIVTDFGLICDHEFMVALVGSIYMAGLFFGSYLFGMLSDRLGRKKTTMTAIIIGALFQTIGAWMPGYYSYTVTRFGSAIGKSNYLLSSDRQ